MSLKQRCNMKWPTSSLQNEVKTFLKQFTLLSSVLNFFLIVLSTDAALHTITKLGKVFSNTALPLPSGKETKASCTSRLNAPTDPDFHGLHHIWAGDSGLASFGACIYSCVFLLQFPPSFPLKLDYNTTTWHYFNPANNLIYCAQLCLGKLATNGWQYTVHK